MHKVCVRVCLCICVCACVCRADMSCCAVVQRLCAYVRLHSYFALMYCTPGHAAGAIVRVLRACRAERACAWDVVVHRPSAHARTGPSKPPSYCCCCCRRFDAAAAAAAEPEGLEVGGRHSQHSHGKRINYGRFACVHALGFKVYPSRVHQFQRYRTPRHSVNEILPPPTPSLPPPARPFFRNRFGVFSEIDRF